MTDHTIVRSTAQRRGAASARRHRGRRDRAGGCSASCPRSCRTTGCARSSRRRDRACSLGVGLLLASSAWSRLPVQPARRRRLVGAAADLSRFGVPFEFDLLAAGIVSSAVGVIVGIAGAAAARPLSRAGHADDGGRIPGGDQRLGLSRRRPGLPRSRRRHPADDDGAAGDARCPTRPISATRSSWSRWGYGVVLRP